MNISDIMENFKLTRVEVYKACDIMGIKLQPGIDEYRGFNDGAIVNGKKVFHHIVSFYGDAVSDWSDVERLHDYACGYLGFDPCKQN